MSDSIPNPNEHLSLREASEIFGYHPDHLGRLIREGKLYGKRAGRSWVTTRAALTHYASGNHDLAAQAPLLSSPEYVSLKEASELSGYHPDHLSRLIRQGALYGKRAGRGWATTRVALANYLSGNEELAKQEVGVDPRLALSGSTPGLNLDELEEGVDEPSPVQPSVGLEKVVAAPPPVPAPAPAVSAPTPAPRVALRAPRKRVLGARSIALILAAPVAGALLSFGVLAALGNEAGAGSLQGIASRVKGVVEGASNIALQGFSGAFLQDYRAEFATLNTKLDKVGQGVEELLGRTPEVVREEVAVTEVTNNITQEVTNLTQENIVEEVSDERIVSAVENTDLSGLSVSGLSDLDNVNVNGRLSVDGSFAVAGTVSAPTFKGGGIDVGNAELGSLTVAESAILAGDIELGGALATVAITSSIWNITSAGVASGFTELSVDNLKLDGNTLSSVAGALVFAPLAEQSLLISLSGAGDFLVNADDFVVDTSTGNVGIGVTDPGEELTLASSYALGWDDGAGTADVTLYRGGANTLQTDDVFIVNNDLSVSGDLQVLGITAADGDVDLGDAVTDTVTFIGVVDSDIVPETSTTYDFGSASRRWAAGYFDTITANTLTGVVAGGATTSPDWTINSDNATANAELSTLSFETGTGDFNATLQWNAAGDAGRVSGFDDTIITNYPLAVYSEVSGGSQTFTSGTLFSYSQPAAHAITQSGALTGIEIDFSSNITNATGAQTGIALTLKDGNVSGGSSGITVAGTADYGIDLSPATYNLGALILPIGTTPESGIDFSGAAGDVVLYRSAAGTLSTNGRFTIGSGSSAGLLIGGDALLYRASSNHLRTDSSLTVDDNLNITGNTIGNYALFQTSLDVWEAYAFGGTSISSSGIETALDIVSDGQLQLPTSGSSAGLLLGGDVNLYRGAANRLDLGSGDSLNIINGGITINRTTNPYLLLNYGGTDVGQLRSNSTSTLEITNSTGGTAYLSVNTSTGQVALPTTGSSAGLLLGGDTQLYRGAADRLDLASGDSLNLVSGSLQVGGSTVVSSSGTLSVPGAYATIGSGDSNNGILEIFGDGVGSNNGALVRLYTSADHDSVFDYFTLNVFNDDLNIGVGEAFTALSITNAGQLQAPVTGSSAGLLIGGDVQLYRSAANQLTIPDSVLVQDGSLWVKTAGGAQQTNIRLGVFEDGASTALYEFSTADVGGDKLDLHSNRWASNVIFSRSSVDGYQEVAAFQGDDNAGNRLYIYDATTTTANIGLRSNSYSYFNGGDVIIGTTATPLDKLEVFGASENIRINNTDETEAGIIFSDSQDTANQNASILFHASSHLLSTYVNNTAVARFSSAGQLQLPTTGSSAGLLIGGDTNLYRSAANELSTSDHFKVANLSSSGTAYFGSEDSGWANLLLYGNGAGNAYGGRLIFEFAADYDALVNSLTLAAHEDDLLFELSSGIDVARLTSAGQFQIPTSGSSAGLLIGGDAQLYRAFADAVSTGIGDQFRVVPSASGDQAFSVLVNGESSSRFILYGSGQMSWGSGSAPADVSLYRGAANRLDLANGDSLAVISGGVTVGASSGVERFNLLGGNFFINGTDSTPGIGTRYQYDTAANSFWINPINDNALAIGGTGGTPPASGAINILSSSGNVGIGVASPAVKLHVDGVSDTGLIANSGLFISGDATGAHLSLDANEIMAKASGTSVAPLYIQNEGGSVNILAATPGTFAVNGSGLTVNSSNQTTLGGRLTLQRGDGSSADIGRIYGGSDANDYIEINGAGSDDHMSFVVNATELARINANGQFQVPTIGSSAGLLLGGDIQLYRGGADSLFLGTDDNVRFTGSTVSSNAIQTIVSGDSNYRFRVQANGTLVWGSGAASEDVSLFRSTTDTLAASDNFIIGASTAASETLSHSDFSLSGDDLFVAGSAGIEGSVYTDGEFIVGGATSILGDGYLRVGGEGSALLARAARVSGSLTTSGNEITDRDRVAPEEGDGRIPNDSSYGVWEASTNLLPNGGFETNVSDWSINTEGTFEQDTTRAKFGSASGKLTSDGANSLSRVLTNLSGETLTQGTVYTASIWVYAEGSVVGKNMQLLLWESGGSQGSQALNIISGSYSPTLQAGWNRYTVTASLVQSDRTSIQLYVGGTPGLGWDDGTVVYFDGAQVEMQPVATPYIETDGATASRDAAEVEMPTTNILDETQGWIAVRVRSGWGNSSEPDTFPGVWEWYDSNNERLSLHYRGSNNQWEMRRWTSGGGNDAVVADSVSSGDYITIIGAWTATEVKLSVDGASFTSTNNSSIPTLSATLARFGVSFAGAAQWLDSDIMWAAAGTGTLSDSDAATIHSFGNKDPRISKLPSGSAATFVWTADNAWYEGTNASPQSILTFDDVDLYRSAPETLEVGGALSVTGNLSFGGSFLPTAAPSGGNILRSTNSVDTSNNVGAYSSIAIGSDGYPVIAFYDTTNSDLRFVKCGDLACSNGNEATTLDSTGEVGTHLSLAIPEDGLPVISYYDSTNTNLKVVKCGDDACSSGNTITTVDSTNNTTGQYSSIAIGSDGYPVIAYEYRNTFNNPVLRVAKCSNATCSSSTTQNVHSGPSALDFIDIAIGSDGNPVISFRNWDGFNRSIRVAHCSDESCSSSTLTSGWDNDSNLETYTSITIGSDGYPVVVWHRDSDTTLRFVKCNSLDCTSASAPITLETGNHYGTYASIAIGSDGLPVISHYNQTSNDLRIVKCEDESCSSTNAVSPDTTGNVGQYSSIAIGADGYPVVSYYDATNDDLKVLRCVDHSCAAVSGQFFTGGADIGSSGLYFNNVYANRYWGKSFSIANFDLAEEYFSEDELTPGTIVSVYSGEGGRTDQVQQSSTPYEDTLMGIVSTQPGITLADWQQQDRTGMYPIALAGRVPVKVSNENGDIKPGDAITSSSVPGIGMKATQPGRIVGIALTGFEADEEEGGGADVMTGTVTIFVSAGYHIPSEYFEALAEGEEGGGTAFFQNFVDLVLKVRTLVASLVQTDRIEVKNPYGITIYDTVTGEPYCVVSEGGELKSLPGTCEEVGGDVEPVQPQQQDPVEEPATEESGQQTAPEGQVQDGEVTAEEPVEAPAAQEEAPPATEEEVVEQQPEEAPVQEEPPVQEDPLVQEQQQEAPTDVAPTAGDGGEVAQP